MKKQFFSFLLLYSCLLCAQEYFPKNDGVKTTSNKITAFVNAKIFITPTKIVEDATLIIKNDKIIGVGKNLEIPKQAQIIDLTGKSMYPSFIDAYSTFGIRVPTKRNNNSNITQYDAERKGYYWNDHIRPDINPISYFKFDNKQAKELLEIGFGLVNTHLEDGIIRGNGILVSINPNTTNSYRILDDKSAQYLSFSKSNTSHQVYPSSLMGAMALLRQTYHDANWYAKGQAKNKDLALEALNSNKNLPQIFNANGKLNALRADKIGDEFNIQYTIVGNGDEFENIDEIKATNATFIIPINFRAPYDVSNPYLAKSVSLSDMRKWNQEPSNLTALSKNKIPFSLTTYKLENINDFTKNLQKAITYGFDKTKALEALTTIPAKILGKTTIGNLNKNSFANFLITSGDIFDHNTILYENWTQGDKNIIYPINNKDITGSYNFSLNGESYEIQVTRKGTSYKVFSINGKETIPSKLSFQDNWIFATIPAKNSADKFIRLTANVSNTDLIQGKAIDEKGYESIWSAIRINKNEKSNLPPKNNQKTPYPIVLPITYPNTGYGLKKIPKQELLLFKNITVWTGEKEGILKNTDVLIKNGKIHKIGKNLFNERAKVIDGIGKHLTAGIIDEHSHIATHSVNEWSQNSSAEVTIEDVVNPEDINIYRNLAGGVTSIQILHGSANPIGGRSAIIKLKWGENADNMIYRNPPKFIKFALGENVKQSRSQNGTRFPQTRMGVEQVYIDYFTRAKEYDKLKKNGKPYRKDIELETLAEILNKKRFISCHSYVQSEINMLMKVAERFNFTVNTFTHILEGYKIADKMKTHGVGASTFSDWWAYKYEVNDAIPYNAAIMHSKGITVAINSDDPEMARRLNQEAAKTIKYGNLSEEEAWKTITINPAKLLHIDDKVGSIKLGKDADLVLWSGNPLSIYSKPEKTIIEGRVYFDLKKDLAQRKSIKTERSLLINMMLHEKIKGSKMQAPSKKIHELFHCETLK
ncbi:amidohydrolase family protein [Tenacibaculum maritimum]|uniref:amidohydrolase family protein n=1 Tax=Tenacibaculum maritimum TaxID=107401 RepID=UPI003875C30F